MPINLKRLDKTSKDRAMKERDGWEGLCYIVETSSVFLEMQQMARFSFSRCGWCEEKGWGRMQNHFLLEKSETNSLSLYVQKDCMWGALSSHPGRSPPASLIRRNWLDSRYQFPNLFCEEIDLARCHLTEWKQIRHIARVLRRRSEGDLCFPRGPPVGRKTRRCPGAQV